LLQQPSKYGTPIGAFIPLEEKPVVINLRNSGVNTSVTPAQLEEGEAVDAIDVRFTKGGVLSDFGITAFGTAYTGAGVKKIMNLANFQTDIQTRFLVRMRPTGWDRWNGINWFTLPGALTGGPNDYYSATTAEGLLIAANGVDKLKKWNGLDATAIADLSADSPIARYVVKIGSRLLAAVIKVGGVIDYGLTAWSADGNIQDWTNANAGAGSAKPPNEGGDDTPNHITGLSTLERGALIYRQRTIQLASLTGVGAAPFRFTTLDFSHGTESPRSIARGGLVTGDYYLGYDYMPYHFDGQTATPIGLPIHETLRDSILDREKVIGSVDRNEQEYYLAFPDASGAVTYAWVFSIREYAKNKRLVWRRKTLPAGTASLAYGFLVTGTDPIVNTVGLVVNTVSATPDSFGPTTGPDRMLFGSDDGLVSKIDQSIVITNSSWISKQYLYGQEVTLDRVRLQYKATTAAAVLVSVSTDGGVNFDHGRVYLLPPTDKAEDNLSQDFGIVSRQLQFKVQIMSGYVSISQLECTLQPRGRGNA
jgi:hypothetical protein